MKISYAILCTSLLLLAGLAAAEVTIEGVPGNVGSVYTTGSIYVASTPSGATALLDGGAAYLYTPGTFSALSAGEHQVIFAKPGFQTLSRNVSVVVGETKNLIVTLDVVVSPGGLSVSSTPKGALLYVDGISQGKTNQVVGNLAPGQHLVTIETAGYETWSQLVTVKSGEVIPVTANLVAEVNPPTGDLRVSSTPSGAAVYVNGNYEGTTPADSLLDVVDLPPGTANVVLTKSGYLDYKTTATIQAGQLVQVFATLTPAPAPAGATAEITSTPSGANVYINNVFIGITPLTFQNVTPGTYAIQITLDGYTPYSTTGQVSAGQNVRVSASLAPVTTPTPTSKAPASLVPVLVSLGAAGIVTMRMVKRE
jgi:hypothetical protein